MHRSRLGVVLIDHPEETFDRAATFWAATRGPLPPTDDPASADPYLALPRLPGGVQLELQRTGAGTPPRVHIDIETDDVDAEIARLVGLGAEVVDRREEYAIMCDPGGLSFCVVPVQTGDEFERHATTWE